MKTYIKPELNIEILNLKEIMLESQVSQKAFDPFGETNETTEWWLN